MIYRILVVLAFIAYTQSVFAQDVLPDNSVAKPKNGLDTKITEDTLATVMQRMQPKSAVKIAYQETRYLQLLEKPWKASGYLYALVPDVLVKEQQIPVREIMGASGNQMVYYDPVNDVRNRGEMASDDPLSLNVAAFKALVTGDLALLEKMYRVAFSANPQQWQLILTSHEHIDTSIKVIITGPAGQQAQKIVVHQPDGDRNEFILTEVARGEQLKATIEQLNQELEIVNE